MWWASFPRHFRLFDAQLKAEFKVLYARWRAGSLRKQQEEYDEKLAEARDAGPLHHRSPR